MTGCDELIWRGRQRTKEGKRIRRGGAQAGPLIGHRAKILIHEIREELGGKGAQMRKVGQTRGGVEAGVFDRRPDEGVAGAGTQGAGDDVDLRCADDLAQLDRWGKDDGEHLALARNDGCDAPGASRMNETSGIQAAVGCGDPEAVAGLSSGDKGCLLQQSNRCVADGGVEGGGELARIDAVLCE